MDTKISLYASKISFDHELIFVINFYITVYYFYNIFLKKCGTFIYVY